MGIPRLLSLLEPYGEHVSVTSDDSSDKHKTNVIIDGPAFAFHIYDICLALTPNARNAFEALPSYKLLGDVAIQWLNQLESFPFRIHAIFFDGLLPDSKRDVRLSRVRYGSETLASCKASLSLLKSVLQAPAHAVETAHLSDPLSVSRRAYDLPALPFMVNAILDALFASPYASITSVVAGEADHFCTQQSLLCPGPTAILTNDSDLLIHELKSSTTIIILKSMTMTRMSMQNFRLQYVQFSPHAVAARLGLDDLLQLGAAMDVHSSYGTPRLTLAQAVAAARKIIPDNTVLAEHRTPPPQSTLEMSITDAAAATIKPVLQRLAASVSELVHIVHMGREAQAEHSDAKLDRTFRIYLSTFIQDPARANVWRISVSYRTLGYSLLQLLDPSCKVVSEIIGHGRQTIETQRQTLDLDDVITSLDNLVHDLQAARNLYHDLDEQRLWRMFAARVVYNACIRSNSALPEAGDLSHVIMAHFPQHLTWETVQLQAQIEAMLYSLRILKQLTHLVIACNVQCDIPAPVLDALSRLDKSLEQMPDLATLFDWTNTSDDQTQQHVVGHTLALIPKSHMAAVAKAIDKPEGQHDASKSRKKKKTIDASFASGNAYAALLQLDD